MAEDIRNDPLLRDVPESEGRKQLDSCIFEELIGRGGMGAVYLARHRSLEIDVAVKCLLPAMAVGNPDMVSRFAREAKLAARLNHPNIVRVFDVNHRHGLHYIVMEYVAGETARGRVTRKGGPLSPGEAVTIVLEAARGLAAVHAEGIVHRDIKPDNILISKRGEVKLADLGLGCLREEAGSGSSLTLSGIAIGTPRYMPPEQWEGLVRVGPPGDVWALGATLYFLLAGEEAWPGNQAVDIMRRICTEPFPDIRRKAPSVPRALTEVIDRCTATDPGQRYPTAGQLVAALEEVIAKHKLMGSLEGSPVEGARSACGVVSPPPRARSSKALDVTASMISPAGASRARTASPRSAARRTVEACIVGAVFAGLAMFIAKVVPFHKGWAPEQVAEASGSVDSRIVPPPAPVPDAAPVSPEPEEAPAEAPVQVAIAEKPAAVEKLAAVEKPVSLESTAAVVEKPAPPPPAPEPAPDLRVDVPPEGAWIPSPVVVAGMVRCKERCVVRAGDQETTVANGKWSLGLRLPDGDATITVRAADVDGRETVSARSIHVDSEPPSLEMVEPASGGVFLTREARLPVRVRANDRGEVREARIRGALAFRDTDGLFTLVVPLTEGDQEILIEAVDQAGNVGKTSFRARRDSSPPLLTLLEPHERAAAGRVMVRGRVKDASPCRVRVNGEQAVVAAEGTWQVELGFELGTRTLRVESSDAAGNESVPVVESISVGPRKITARDIPGFTRLGKNEQGFHEYRHDRTGIVMVLIPAGTFLMGSSPEEETGVAASIDAREKDARSAALLKRCVASELPRHEVTFSSFLVAKDELSQRAWRAIMGTEPSGKRGDDLPVENISWFDAKELCRRAGLFLPTEAQWECAARAGALSQGGLGIRDMLGGVSEWCEDVYFEGFYATDDANAPNPVATSASRSILRCVRGGSWASPAWARRPASRQGSQPGRASPLRGLRPAFYPVP